jgi:hypothetical protein
MQKRLYLDTDWATAAAMVLLFAVCVAMEALILTRIVQGAPAPVHITWETWVAAGFGTWLFFEAKDRALRATIGVALLGTVSGIILSLLRASVTVQLANAAIVRVIDMFLWGGAGVYTIWWFSSRIRRV